MEFASKLDNFFADEIHLLLYLVKLKTREIYKYDQLLHLPNVGILNLSAVALIFTLTRKISSKSMI